MLFYYAIKLYLYLFYTLAICTGISNYQISHHTSDTNYETIARCSDVSSMAKHCKLETICIEL